MTGKNLFEKRRACTWHTHDEDRSCVTATQTFALLEKALGKTRFHSVNASCILGALVIDRGLMKGIALFIMMEREVVLTVIFRGFSQRKVKLHLTAEIDIRSLYLQVHLLDVFRRETQGLQVSQTPVGFAKSAIALYCTPIGGLTLLSFPLSL